MLCTTVFLNIYREKGIYYAQLTLLIHPKAFRTLSLPPSSLALGSATANPLSSLWTILVTQQIRTNQRPDILTSELPVGNLDVLHVIPDAASSGTRIRLAKCLILATRGKFRQIPEPMYSRMRFSMPLAHEMTKPTLTCCRFKPIGSLDI